MNMWGLAQLREYHDMLIASMHAISMNMVVALDSAPTDISDEEKVTL
jgi:hypothetical protein